MAILSLEHGKTAYAADFVLYAVAIVALAGELALAGPAQLRLPMALLVAVGMLTWSLAEYLIHRFIFHGLEPFRRWHGEHHDRPTALIGTSTLVSASVITVLAALPALWLLGRWLGGAFTLGILIGYFAYGGLHHGLHHWRSDAAWLKRRKVWHAKHHHHVQRPGHYGVTSAFWDHVFGTAKAGRG